jgi:HK97 family phage major capsid protein
MRDDYTGADSGIVKFRARKRTGGKPVLSEAMVLLKATVSGS